MAAEVIKEAEWSEGILGGIGVRGGHLTCDEQKTRTSMLDQQHGSRAGRTGSRQGSHNSGRRVYPW